MFVLKRKIKAALVSLPYVVLLALGVFHAGVQPALGYGVERSSAANCKTGCGRAEQSKRCNSNSSSSSSSSSGAALDMACVAVRCNVQKKINPVYRFETATASFVLR